MERPPLAGSKLDVRVAVELGEELPEVDDAEGEHPGLVAVIARAPVALLEGAREGELRHFLAVAEYAELGFARQHFLAPDYRRETGGEGQLVIA